MWSFFDILIFLFSSLTHIFEKKYEKLESKNLTIVIEKF